MSITVDRQFDHLLEYLERTRGFDFRDYKRGTLLRRIGKRMHDVGVESFEAYVDHLEVHPDEFTALFNTILINVTGFFREPDAWEFLSRDVVPRIIETKAAAAPIRVWSAGCSSGEEAYTLAMVLAEALGENAFRRRVKIYGTDVDEEALTQARHGTYSEKVLEAVPDELRGRYFQATPTGGFTFRGDLRRSVIFGHHNLIQDAPISRLALLVCRNTLMYFNAEIQRRILTRFHFALDDSGFLFLGKAEMILSPADLFVVVQGKHRIFAKSGAPDLRERVTLLAQAGNGDVGGTLVRHARTRDVAFDLSALAQVVVDADGVLVTANHQARSIFGINERDVGRPFHDLELSYRPVELRARIEQAYSERRPIHVKSAEHVVRDGHPRYFDVEIVPLLDDGTVPLGVSVTFDEVSQYRALEREIERSTQELETAYEELQSTNEELETTNEELQSTVEELETTNEELQSTNEELETMNEELQSANEELNTINDELRERTEELNGVNVFLSSILTSLRVGVVVVDDRLRVQVWNAKTTDLWGLRADEVTGSAFFSLDVGLPLAPLRGVAAAILSGDSSYDEVTLEATNRRGQLITCRVTCSPLIDGDRRRGVIMLMEEVDGRPPT